MKTTMTNALSYKQLSCVIDCKKFAFDTTSELEPLTEYMGQERAIDALRFGLGMPHKGYNIYVLGPAGVGKFNLVQQVITEVVENRELPSDWCYVHNFNNPNKPIALKLSAGCAAQLCSDVENLIVNLQQDGTLGSVILFIEKLKLKYETEPSVIEYLKKVQQDLEKNSAELFSAMDQRCSRRYKVNVLVDHNAVKNPPCVYMDDLTCENLLGRIEYVMQAGSLFTDFNLIKPGILHKANGGYLIIDALKLLAQPQTWDALKRTLYAEIITIEPVTNSQVGLPMTVLEPMPIPLALKVILIGNEEHYQLLAEADPDFMRLFKVTAELAETVVNNFSNVNNYARLIAGILKKENLYPAHKAAVARVIEYSMRLVEDVERLSLQIDNITDMLREAHYWARLAGAKVIEKEHIEKALDKYYWRVSQTQQLIYEDIKRGNFLIETVGSKVGQANVLCVEEFGNFKFGYPTRITSIARLGKGEVIDITREVEQGGSIHSKGVLTLIGYIAGYYAKENLLSLMATLVFEQTYATVDGDSASVGELCALLSALAEVPIKQSLAVTGSVNQFGEIQPVGDINEKIEGFFDVCNEAGLSNSQGVLIPAANIKHLMLKAEVVAAVAANKFHIYAVKTVNEALTLLTGFQAGERSKSGKFPSRSVNYVIEQTLQEFAKKAQRG